MMATNLYLMNIIVVCEVESSGKVRISLYLYSICVSLGRSQYRGKDMNDAIIDTLYCNIYPVSTGVDINALCASINKFMCSLCKDYIYQWEGMKFEVDATSAVRARLIGACKYGDNIVDEWFVVWQVIHITHLIYK